MPYSHIWDLQLSNFFGSNYTIQYDSTRMECSKLESFWIYLTAPSLTLLFLIEWETHTWVFHATGLLSRTLTLGGFSYATKNAEARAAAIVYATRHRVRPQTNWLINMIPWHDSKRWRQIINYEYYDEISIGCSRLSMSYNFCNIRIYGAASPTPPPPCGWVMVPPPPLWLWGCGGALLVSDAADFLWFLVPPPPLWMCGWVMVVVAVLEVCI